MSDQTPTIPNGWKYTTLGEVVYPVSDTFNFSGIDKVHFLNTGDILEGKLLHHNTESTKSLPGQAKKRFKINDILYSEIRPANKRYMLVNFDSSNSVASTKLMVLRVKEGVDVNYIYKIITFDEVLKEFQSIAESRSGTFPQITFEAVSQFPILLPTKEEQIEIVAALSSLDDKIELLHEQNKTLEATAQAIFKEWFVNFNFPGFTGEMIDSELGKLPNGWGVARLLNFGNIICGKTPSKNTQSYFGGTVPFIKIPDMHGQVFISHTEDTLTEQGANSQKNKYLPEFSICVSCIATVGLVSICSKRSQTNQQINSIVPKSPIYLEYLYFRLKDMEGRLQALGAGGSATLNINTTTFSNLEIVSPEICVLEKYHNVTSPLFQKLNTNNFQIKTLTSLRNFLLPVLIRGDVRVKEFDN